MELKKEAAQETANTMTKVVQNFGTTKENAKKSLEIFPGVRTGFTFLRSYYEQLQIIADPMERLQMYDALADYALNRNKPDFGSGKFSALQRMFWTGILPLLDNAWSKYDAGKLGGAPPGNINASKGKTSRKQSRNKQKQTHPSIDKEIDIDKDIDIEGEREKEFIPPALDDVLSYYSSTHGKEIEKRIAIKFINYYSANGWTMSNGAKMADWQSAFESWCDREPKFNAQKINNNYDDNSAATQEEPEQPGQHTSPATRPDGEGRGLDSEDW